MTTSPTHIESPAVPLRNGPAIALMVASAFVVVVNEMAMGAAIPDIMADFGRGVPFYVIDNTYALSGAQPVEQFLAAFDRAVPA